MSYRGCSNALHSTVLRLFGFFSLLLAPAAVAAQRLGRVEEFERTLHDLGSGLGQGTSGGRPREKGSPGELGNALGTGDHMLHARGDGGYKRNGQGAGEHNPNAKGAGDSGLNPQGDDDIKLDAQRASGHRLNGKGDGYHHKVDAQGPAYYGHIMQRPTDRPSMPCPRETSPLYSARKVRGAAEALARKDLAKWDPPAEGRYLLLYCDYGRLSNRVLCIKNHIILAALLNRSLLVHPRSLPSYDPRLLLDTSHLRTCFGPRAAFMAGELTSPSPLPTSPLLTSPLLAPPLLTSTGVTSAGAGVASGVAGAGLAAGVRGGGRGEENGERRGGTRGAGAGGQRGKGKGEQESGRRVLMGRETRGESSAKGRVRSERGRVSTKRGGESGAKRGERGKREEEIGVREREKDKRERQGLARGKGVVPYAWVCWSTLVKLDRRTWQVRRTRCTNSFCQLNFQRLEIPEPATKADVCLTNLDSIVRGYTRKWGNVRTLIIGDLTMMGFLFPPKFRHFGDAPFLRAPGCPNALALSPHPLFFSLASDYLHKNLRAKNSNSSSNFVGVHFRRGDFLAERCMHRFSKSMDEDINPHSPGSLQKGVPNISKKLGVEDVPGACLSTVEAASFLASEISASGVPNLVICTDAGEEEVRELTAELKRKTPHLGKILLNPPIPPDRGLEGMVGEGEATFQKLVLALSTVFVGTETSTFSADVERMRIGLGRANCRDTFLGSNQTSQPPQLLDIYVSSIL